MRPDLTTALTAIEYAIGDPPCQHCGQPRGTSVSDDFCSEDCQQAWQARHAVPPPPASGTAPD